MPYSFTNEPWPNIFGDFYTELEGYLDGISAGTVADGSITAAKLASDSVTTVKILDANVTLAKLEAAVQTSLGLADSALQPGEIELANGTPVNAVAAQAKLSISGVVKDGETVTIDTDVYEFASDAAQTVSGSNIAVDISASTTASQGTLTVDTNPSANDTMTIGTTVYTFVENPPLEAGEIAIGVDLDATKLNIVAAINGTDGVNTAHALVSAAAFATNDCVITALAGGTAGDAIATTETFTALTNIFDSTTLGTTTPGADCSAANAETALVAADAGSTYSLAASGTADAVIATAATKGVAGNSLACTETMAKGEWDDTTFGTETLGVDGTVGTQWQTYVDSSYLYVCVAANTISGDNWRRISLGSAY